MSIDHTPSDTSDLIQEYDVFYPYLEEYIPINIPQIISPKGNKISITYSDNHTENIISKILKKSIDFNHLDNISYESGFKFILKHTGLTTYVNPYELYEIFKTCQSCNIPFNDIDKIISNGKFISAFYTLHNFCHISLIIKDMIYTTSLYLNHFSVIQKIDPDILSNLLSGSSKIDHSCTNGTLFGYYYHSLTNLEFYEICYRLITNDLNLDFFLNIPEAILFDILQRDDLPFHETLHDYVSVNSSDISTLPLTTDLILSHLSSKYPHIWKFFRSSYPKSTPPNITSSILMDRFTFINQLPLITPVNPKPRMFQHYLLHHTDDPDLLNILQYHQIFSQKYFHNFSPLTLSLN